VRFFDGRASLKVQHSRKLSHTQAALTAGYMYACIEAPAIFHLSVTREQPDALLQHEHATDAHQILKQIPKMPWVRQIKQKRQLTSPV
jgi:hypothetical protein